MGPDGGHPVESIGRGAAGGTTCVALDAMGGDHAPAAVVRGALLALEQTPGVSLALVGDRERVLAALREADGEPGDRLSVVHAEHALGMAENPVAGLKAKPDTSIARALRLVGEGHASAVFSAGNTGGVVAAATMHLQRIRGVKRPGIAVPLPTMGGPCLVIDAGANLQCRPMHLVHYAVMASAYARAVLGVQEPRVGILNIGEEEGKGTSLIKETTALLKATGLRFVGNVEGHALFRGMADVALCDGFVGNMVLKTTEGAAECVLALLQGSLREVQGQDPAVARTLGGVLSSLKGRLDYAAYGGAPLLGFEGVVLIGHGRSSPEAVANAVRGAVEFASREAGARIREAVAAAGPAGGDEPAPPAPAAPAGTGA